MSFPVNLQTLPSSVFEEVFTPENVRARPSVNCHTSLSFPKSRSALWDCSPAGHQLRLHLCSYRKPQLVLLEKALRLAQRHVRYKNKSHLHGFFLGSMSVSSDEEGVILTLDRFDPGRKQSLGTVPSALLPGDILVPCLFTTEAVSDSAVQSESAFHNCFKELQQFLGSRQSLDLSQLVKVRGHVFCSQLSDAASFGLSWSAVCPSVSLDVQPIRAIPIIPTALLRSLTSINRPLQLTSNQQRGFLTMDQTRKLLLLLESDPKASNLPLVGLWLSGVTHIYNPQVWAWCLRFLFSSSLHDRALSESGCFLIVVFSSTHRTPQFFQCRVPGLGQESTPQLGYQLLTVFQSVTLYQVASVDGQSLQCELGSDDHSREMEVFTKAQSTFTSASPLAVGLYVGDQDSGVEDEDLSPRPSPSPHSPAQQTHRVQPTVPELSLIIDSSFTSNQPAPTSIPPLPPAADRKSAPSAGATFTTTTCSVPTLAAPSPSLPHLQSTPNSNLQQPCICCSTQPYDCASNFSSPGLHAAAASPSSNLHHAAPSLSSLRPAAPSPSSLRPAAPSPSSLRPAAPSPSSLRPAAPPPSSFPSAAPPPSSLRPAAPPPSSFPSAAPPPSSFPSAAPPPSSFPSAAPPPSSFPSAAPPPSSFPSAAPPPSSFPSAAPPLSNLQSIVPPSSNIQPAAPPPSSLGPVAPPPSRFPPAAPQPSSRQSIVPPSSNLQSAALPPSTLHPAGPPALNHQIPPTPSKICPASSSVNSSSTHGTTIFSHHPSCPPSFNFSTPPIFHESSSLSTHHHTNFPATHLTALPSTLHPPPVPRDGPPCGYRCCNQVGGAVPSDTYQLLLHQDQQLRLLQAQVQMLLEAQKKLQTSSQQDTQVPRSTAIVAVETVASLFWGCPDQPLPREVQSPCSSSSPTPLQCPSPIHSTSSHNLSVVAEREEGDVPGLVASCPLSRRHSISSLESPVLEKSVSMYRPADNQQSFYLNLLTQLTSRLQESESKQESEVDRSRRKTLSVVSGVSQSSLFSPTCQSSSSSGKEQSPVADPVESATLQQLGVDVDKEVLTESDRNRVRTVESNSTLTRNNSAAVVSRLGVSDLTVSSLLPRGSMDLSLEANAIDLRYVSDTELRKLSLGGPSSQPAPASSCNSLLSPNNMSVATRKYMKRLGLIEEEEDGEDEEKQEEINVQKASSRQPLTEALNVKLLAQSQLIRDLRPKVHLLVDDSKPNTGSDKENRSSGRMSLGRASNCQTEGSVGNILDLSRLRQLPKLF